MSNMNIAIFKANIQSLMDRDNITQQKLGEAIGMQQPDISKRLKTDDDSRCFTLEQAWAIADFFNVSLDKLLGRDQFAQVSSKDDICRMLISLIRKYRVVHFPVKKSEEVWNPETIQYNHHPDHKDVTYNAFYFPDYDTPPEYLNDLDDDRIEDLRAKAINEGNDIPENMSINRFLQQYIDAFEKYDAYNLNKEDFDILVDAYFRILNKKEKPDK